MSYLVAIPGSADHAKSAHIIPYIFNQKDYSEIGVTYALDNTIHRKTDFNSTAEMNEFLSAIPYTGALIYVNNHKIKLQTKSCSPVLVSEDWSFASCGNMIETTERHAGQSNTEVFVDQILRPCAEHLSAFISSYPFNWMMAQIARPYVGGAFLRKDGHLVLFNSGLFNQSTTGYYYMDFEGSKSRHYKTRWRR
jgi:hypothetical protein